MALWTINSIAKHKLYLSNLQTFSVAGQKLKRKKRCAKYKKKKKIEKILHYIQGYQNLANANVWIQAASDLITVQTGKQFFLRVN